MNREDYIKEIDEYHEILGLQIEREYDPYCVSEKESVYDDILQYEDEDYEYNFNTWYTKDFVDYIKYLEKLTGITNKLGIK